MQVKSANRKAQLDNAYLLQMFLGESRDLVISVMLDVVPNLIDRNAH